MENILIGIMIALGAWIFTLGAVGVASGLLEIWAWLRKKFKQILGLEVDEYARSD